MGPLGVPNPLLYACKAWAAGSDMVRGLEIIQMHCLRRILQLLRRGRNENAATLARAKIETVHAMVI